MITSCNGDIYIWVEVYLMSLSWERRILARFFDKYKITEKEYLEWVYNKILTPHPKK